MSLRLAGTLISGAMLGKLLGFAREIEMARLLGANIIADSFRAAFTAVLLPVAPIQSDMLPSVVIPLHREWSARGEAGPGGAALAVLLTGLASLVAVLVYCLAAPWVGLLVGGFDAATQALTVRCVQVMSLAIPASVLSACLSAIEIATGTSRIAAIRASVQNLVVMGGIAVMAFGGLPLAVPWSFVVAFNLIAGYGLARLWRAGVIVPRALGPRLLADVGLTFWRRFRPLLTIPLADQGNILLERLLASAVAVGALASIDYARTLTESAFYLISQPIGYVVLTRALQKSPGRGREIERIAQRLLAVGLPISVFVAIFATDIVQVVFARGAFDAHAVALTADALRGISVGLWAAVLGWVLVRMVNVDGRNFAAAAIVVSAYAGNALFNVIAVPVLGTLGIGLGESVRALILLGATGLTLGHGGLLLRCLARAAIPAAALAGAGFVVCGIFAGSLARVGVAGSLFAAATIGWLAWHMPERTAQLASYLRRPRRLATATGRRN